MSGKIVKCLGWCGGTFYSEEPSAIRFCKKCKILRDNSKLSKWDKHTLKSSNPEENLTTRNVWFDNL